MHENSNLSGKYFWILPKKSFELISKSSCSLFFLRFRFQKRCQNFRFGRFSGSFEQPGWTERFSAYCLPLTRSMLFEKFHEPALSLTLKLVPENYLPKKFKFKFLSKKKDISSESVHSNQIGRDLSELAHPDFSSYSNKLFCIYPA